MTKLKPFNFFRPHDDWQTYNQLTTDLFTLGISELEYEDNAIKDLLESNGYIYSKDQMVHLLMVLDIMAGFDFGDTHSDSTVSCS